MSAFKEEFNLFDVSALFKSFVGGDIGTRLCAFASISESAGSLPRPAVYNGVNAGGIQSLFWCTEDGKIYVADEVVIRDGLKIDPEGVVTSVKMMLTKDKITLHGYEFTPEEILAAIVKRVYEISRDAFAMEYVTVESCKKIPVGVPVRFSRTEREIFKRAVEDGIRAARGKDDFEVILFNESTAVVMSIIYLYKLKGKKCGNFEVIDIGAGTCDTDFLTPNENITPEDPYPYTSHNADGCRIAGDKFDEAMLEIMLEKLREKPGFSMEAFENERSFDYLRLKELAREAKEALSKTTRCEKQITTVDGRSTKIEVERAEFEEKIRPLVAEIVKVARRTAEAAAKDGKNLDYSVVLVGGSAYIPLVKEMVAEGFGISPDEIFTKCPDKAVALGAAAYAASDPLILPRICYGYGIRSSIEDKSGRAEDKSAAKADGDVVRIMLPSGKSTQHKSGSSFVFQTRYEGQSSITFPIYEIGSDVTDSDKVGAVIPIGRTKELRSRYGRYELTYKFPQPVPRKTRVKVDLVLDESCILRCSAARTISSNGKEKTDESTRQSLSFALSNGTAVYV